MSELFTIPESHPPRIVELRRRHDEAKAAFESAREDEDLTGKSIPTHLHLWLCSSRAQLAEEEARCASQFGNTSAATK